MDGIEYLAQGFIEDGKQDEVIRYYMYIKLLNTWSQECIGGSEQLAQKFQLLAIFD